MGNEVEAAEATRIHAAATTQATVLGALQTAPAGRAGWPVGSPAGHDRGGRRATDMRAAVDCGCPDCQAPTSPMAYLADLLRYAIARFSFGGAGATYRRGSEPDCSSNR